MTEPLKTSKEHQHMWQPAGILPQARIHKITGAAMTRPSLVMLCPCGMMTHRWVPAPEEDDTKAPETGPGAGLIFHEEGRA